MANEFSIGFGQGLQSAQSDREYALRQAEMAAQAPLRAAQLSLLGSQIKSANVRAVTDALAAENAVKSQESMAEALDFSSQIAGQYTPENEARLYSFVKQKPWLANTPWFTGMAKDFDVARQMQGREELLTEKLNFERANKEREIQARLDIEKSKEETRKAIEAAKQAGKKDPMAASEAVTRRTAIKAMIETEGLTWAQAEQAYDQRKANEKLPVTEEQEKLDAFYKARKSNPKLTYGEFTGTSKPADAMRLLSVPVGTNQDARFGKLPTPTGSATNGPKTPPSGFKVVRKFDFTPTTK